MLTHLLFVDDVMIFDVGSIEEQQSCKGILDSFCQASGMLIIDRKSSLLEYGMPKEVVSHISHILPYEITSLDCGTKYLGYFLNPNNYLVSDWFRLLKIFDSRINH